MTVVQAQNVRDENWAKEPKQKLARMLIKDHDFEEDLRNAIEEIREQEEQAKAKIEIFCEASRCELSTMRLNSDVARAKHRIGSLLQYKEG